MLSVEEREGSYAKLVNAYYELATLFYEWGWGSSFHFASRWCGESFQQSIKVRGEHWDRVEGEDCGCGCASFDAKASCRKLESETPQW